MRVKYVAEDGAEFDDRDLCAAYEKLIKASKDSAFHSAVEGLFEGCTTWHGGDGLDDPSYKVLVLEKGKDFDKFKANLVRALPRLSQLLNAAMGRFD